MPGLKAIYHVSVKHRIAVAVNLQSEIVLLDTERHTVLKTLGTAHFGSEYCRLSSDESLLVVHIGTQFHFWSMETGLLRKKYTPIYKPKPVDPQTLTGTKASTETKEDAQQNDADQNATEASPKKAKKRIFRNMEPSRKVEFNCFTFSSDGKTLNLLGGSSNGIIYEVCIDSWTLDILRSVRFVETDKDQENSLDFLEKCKNDGTKVAGHAKAITKIMYSPDFKTLLILDGTDLCIRDAETSTINHTIENVGQLSELIFSPTSKYVAWISGLLELSVVDVQLGQVVHTLRSSDSLEDGTVGTLRFSKKGHYLAAGMGKNKVSLFDVSKSENPEITTFKVSTWHHVCFLEFDATEQFLIGDGYQGNVKIWHIPSGQLCYETRLSVSDLSSCHLVQERESESWMYIIGDDRLKAVNLTSHLNLARKHFSEGYDSKIKDYELASLSQQHEQTEDQKPDDAPYESGISLISAFTGTISDPNDALFDMNVDGKPVDDISARDASCFCVMPEGGMVLTATAGIQGKDLVEKWDITTGVRNGIIQSKMAQKILVTADSQYLILQHTDASSNTGKVQIFNLSSGEQQDLKLTSADHPDVNVIAVHLTADSRELIVVTDQSSGLSAIINMSNLTTSHKFKFKDKPKLASGSGVSIFTSSDTRYLILGLVNVFTETLDLFSYDLITTKQNTSQTEALQLVSMAQTSLNAQSFSCVTWTLSDRLLVGTAEGGLVWWDVSGTTEHIVTKDSDTCPRISCLAVCGTDHQTVVVGSSRGQLMVYNLATSTGQTDLKHTDEILCCSISPGNHYIVSGSKDKTIRLWTLDPLTPLSVFQTYAPVTGLQFTPNLNTVVAERDLGYRKQILLMKTLNM